MAAAESNAETALKRLIASQGPITLADYMSHALMHPSGGYYATREPFGAAGDFITAPEISQIFGELIGLWAVDYWERMGAPAALHLVELGPGRGTLMADCLRAAGVVPDFLAAATLDLVETSPRLKAIQEATLAGAALTPRWHDRLMDVPAGPTLLIANEFFDALPVRQYVRTQAGWCERRVALDAEEQFVFALAPGSPPAALIPDEPPAAGSVVEFCPSALAAAGEIGRRLHAHGGAALIIDYGYEGPAAGDTLQAVKGHAHADPLAAPGAADLTAHVNFTALAEVAREAGAHSHGPVAQGRLLQELGIHIRARRLAATATPEQQQTINTGVARLTQPDKMGALFKALALTGPDGPQPAGFEP